MGRPKKSVSELSREFGYAQDGAFNRRINKLKHEGYVTESLELTSKGMRRIAFLLLPRYAIAAIAALSFGYVWWSLQALFFASPIHPELMLVMGIISIPLLAILWWAHQTGEKQFCQIGRPQNEGQDPALQQ